MLTMYHDLLKPFLSDLKTFVIDTLFPIRCLACETEGPKFICDDCAAALTPLAHQFCIICQKMSIGGLTHPKCLTPHTADALISVFDYHDEKVANILIKGKYSFLPAVYQELGKLMAEKLITDHPHLLNQKSKIPASPAGRLNLKLVPIPLHKWRQRWRGFNQSEILAQSLAQNLSASCTSVLVRCKFTRTQKNLKKAERIKNLESAFVLSPPAGRSEVSAEGGRGGGSDNSIIHHQNFLLIDDVTTTGSTLLEAAKVLKRNGAEKVMCLTVARD